MRHTADHVVLANGADPVVPPVPGLARARRCLDQPRGDVDEGRPAPPAHPRRRAGRGGDGAGRASTRRRGGGHRQGRAPARARAGAAGRGARRGSAPRGHRARPRPRPRPRRGARARTTSSSSTTGASCAATGCSSPPAGARGCAGSASRPSASSRTPHGVPVDAHLRAAERLWAIGDVNGIWPLTHVGKYEGEVVAANILGEPRNGQLRGRAARRLHRPAGRGRGRDRRPLQRHGPAVGGGEDRHLHPRLRRRRTAS